MNEYEGELKINYEGRVIMIPYKILNMWGKIFIKFTDKNEVFYSFYYSDTDHIWRRDIKKCPKWPTDFSQIFFNACTKEAKKHRLIR